MSADVTVEIAFDSGYTTPAASRTWTDVSDYVELAETLTMTRGRQDELSEVSPSTLALTFDNRDGRFTPGRAGSPYYPNVRIGRPIRVKVTPDGGAESIRFTGYIDEWPVEWDGTDAYARVPITATSRMARLGLDAPLRSVIEEQILALDPAAYYTLGEAEGATSATDTSGAGASPLRMAGSGTPVTFGTATGPGTDSLTAAQFAGGKWLAGGAVPVDTGSGANGWSLLLALVTSATDHNIAGAYGVTPAVGGLQVRVSTTGRLQLVRDSSTPALDQTLTGTTPIADGSLHTVVLTLPAGGPSFVTYVDGQNESLAPAWQVDTESWSLGNARDAGGQFLTAFTGSLAHVAWTVGGVSASDALAFHQACSTGFAGDTPAARLARYAAYASVPTAEQAFAAGSAPIAHVDTTGQTVIGLMHHVAATDGGVLFDGRDGALTYQARSARYQPPSAVTLLAASQEVESDFAPKLDRSALVNDVTARNMASTISVRALGATSRDEYGVHSEEIELATDNENEIHSAAWWRVNTRAEPTPRVASLSVDALTRGGHNELLGLDISSQIKVTGLPTQAGASTADYFVEGYTETISLASHRFTFNVSDASPWLATWVLDSATRSQLDSTTTLAY